MIELRHADGVAIRGALEQAAKGSRLLENSITLLDQEELDERPGEVRVIQRDAAEHRCQLRFEPVKFRAQRLRNPELEGNIGLER